MIRQSLLLETLVTRRMTRQGNVYMFRRPSGPPPNEALDRWIHKATQVFDFTPMYSGDQQQARWMARDYFEHMKKTARQDGMDWDVVRQRMRQITPYLRRGLNTFFVYYDAQTRSSG